MKYHIKNQLSKKEMKKTHKQPLPLELMRHDQFNGFGPDRRGNSENTVDCQDISLSEDDNNKS